MKALPLCAVALLAAVATSAPVLAETEIRSEAVTFSNAELTSQSGRDALLARIEKAAWAVCEEDGVRGVDVRRLQRQCADEAEAQARLQIETRIAQGSLTIRTVAFD